jgi:formylglycine-generating enzyme required for sulfatase activity
MEWVPGGEFLMGSDDFYPEEAPARRVAVDGFWMDEHPVTVAEFRRFVEDTGHVTAAELAPASAAGPDADAGLLIPGSLVFRPSRGPVDLRDVCNWWDWVPGADWRHPEGPESNVGGRELHPVVHVAYSDAVRYAAWAGKGLATEAEWEFAARGGLEGKTFAWGNEFAPRGRLMANTWQGDFPWQDLCLDGYTGTSPIRAFLPNGYGLYDMTGNVWEWTGDSYRARATDSYDKPWCIPRHPRADAHQESSVAGETIARKVIKGGSHLCAPNYCLRYRPAARQPEAIDTSTSHIGFRCVARPDRGQHGAT